MIARALLVLAPVMLFWSLTAIALANEPVRLEGIEKDTPLYTWVRETVLEKYKTRRIFDNGDADDPELRFSGIRGDAEKALQAKGYYNPQIVFTPGVQSALTIDPGPLYTISEIAATGLEREDMPEIFGIAPGDVLDAENVLEAQRKFSRALQAKGCYYTLRIRNQVVLDHEAQTGSVRFVIEAGPEAVFGETVFEGAPRIKEKHLRRFLRYKEGDCWEFGKLEATKSALIGTGLLSVVREVLPDAPDENGVVNIRFELMESARRSILLGGSFYTDEGLGITAEWRHRNILGSGEELSARFNGNLLEQAIGVGFVKPYFLIDTQKLTISATLGREDTEAFEKLSLRNNFEIERRLASRLTGAAGAGFEVSRIKDKSTNKERNFGLLSLTGRIQFDNRDNTLDPRRGWLLRLRSEPHIDVFGESSPFFKNTFDVATYIAIDNDRDHILALRGRIGTILGGSTADIPASRRFYAGGGHSIRGFGHQEAGPIAANGDPLGGRSLIETAAELRFKVTETIGGVAFVDAGGVYDAIFPDFKNGYYVGAGVGARYYTAFGPIRFDIAVPMNKRAQTDRNFQFYISIGQAF